jgi:YrhK-like protein
VVGHALAFAPRADTRVLWDRSIAIGFAIGSTCFFLGPFPGFAQLVGETADAWIFFAGSIFFTLAAGLELRESTVRLGRWADNPSWWSAAVQFLGTLLFNLSTFDATQQELTTQQTNRLVWAPDAFGSTCFLISGLLAYRVAAGGHLRPLWRDRAWTMAAVNLLGCILFGVSAIASFIVPDEGTILDLAAANWTTALGGLCFLIGALMLLPPARD